MPQFTGLTTKILSIVKKVAPIGGIARGWLSDPLSQGDLSQAMQFITDCIQQFKFANPIKTTQIALSMPDKYPIVEGITGALGGWLVEEGGEAIQMSEIKALGTIWKRYGLSALVNGIAAAYIYLARLNPHGQGYTEGQNRTGIEPSGLGDVEYRTRASAHIRNPAGQNALGPR